MKWVIKFVVAALCMKQTIPMNVNYMMVSEVEAIYQEIHLVGCRDNRVIE